MPGKKSRIWANSSVNMRADFGLSENSAPGKVTHFGRVR